MQVPPPKVHEKALGYERRTSRTSQSDIRWTLWRAFSKEGTRDEEARTKTPSRWGPEARRGQLPEDS